MEAIAAFLLIMICLFIGEWVSKLTKAYLPSMFISAVLFMIGYWTFFPKNLSTLATFSDSAAQLFLALNLVHLGTMMSLKQLLQQWKAVCIALLGVAGTVALTLSVGSMLLGWKTVVAGIPPLTGGIVAALLMTNGLKQQGIMSLAALPIAMVVMHSLVGYPLTSMMLKKEGKRLIGVFKKQGGKVRTVQTADESAAPKKKKQWLPKDYETASFILAKVALVALAAEGFSALLHNAINSSIMCLIFGVIFHQLGFLEDHALEKAGIYNWIMYGIITYCFAQLSLVSPAQLGPLVVRILTLIVLGLIGMFIASFLLAKPFKMTWYMAYACSLTALFGFPMDYLLTNEVAHTVAETPEQEKFLQDTMVPQMLVGGFATVSIASVAIASIFLKIL
ncbi:hypothetical protein PT285_07935 [Lactobacillus sp. ESL0791]|uniref:hypothetical protein n=1 Tax=Lactobacillus sp. ESL0791 TaxID=2983234 RepID=UPI0023FA1FA7|nr:hypothetical protein [Lactobacillus sp. ESL0791]MDF7639328.1 hypothetical protein [Lactobacillus sp. ESL0791]